MGEKIELVEGGRSNLESQSVLKDVDQSEDRFRVLRGESDTEERPSLRDLIRAASDAFWFG